MWTLFQIDLVEALHSKDALASKLFMFSILLALLVFLNMMCLVSKNIYRARWRRSGLSAGGIPTRGLSNVLYCVCFIVVVGGGVVVILCILILWSKNLYQTRRRRSGQSAGGIPTRGRGNVLYCVRLIDLKTHRPALQPNYCIKGSTQGK